MPSPRSRSGRSASVVLAALIPLVLGALAVVSVVAQERALADVRVERDVRASVASSVTKVRTEIRNELAAALAGTTGGTTVPVADISSGRFAVATAIQARDSGTALLDDSARPPAIVAPVYRTTAIPATSAARRAGIVGYRVVPITVEPTLVELAPDGGGLIVRGPRRTVSAVPSRPPAGSHTYSVDMDLTGLPGWRVQGWQRAAALPGLTWFLLLGILAAAIGAALALALLARRYVAVTQRQRQLERDRVLLNSLAPVLQTSLDIGEVVPAAASLLVDGLGLRGVSLAVPTERGERQLFAWGTAPDTATLPAGALPTELRAGATFATGLTRGGRMLGVLRVVAGRALSHDDVLAAVMAGELLGSTLANAEAYGQQQELVERMRAVDELKTVFLATASHELRTPVTAIVGFSSLLLEHWESLPAADARALVERTVANGKRLNVLIEQLLDFSRLERGMMQDSADVLDLGATVARILNEQSELAAEHTLRTDLPPLLSVRGQVAGVERIVTNLVGNAAKYAPVGTAITVHAEPAGDRVLLHVDDEGPGVPVADRQRIFSRFYRGRNSTAAHGAGIGLAIVAEYAAVMSATAAVGEAPGGGARFTVSFPAAGSGADTLAPIVEHSTAEEGVDVAVP